MALQDFFNGILDNKRNAEAKGWRLDLIILPISFQETLFKAVTTQPYAGDAYSLGSKEAKQQVHVQENQKNR